MNSLKSTGIAILLAVLLPCFAVVEASTQEKQHQVELRNDSDRAIFVEWLNPNTEKPTHFAHLQQQQKMKINDAVDHTFLVHTEDCSNSDDEKEDCPVSKVVIKHYDDQSIFHVKEGMEVEHNYLEEDSVIENSDHETLEFTVSGEEDMTNYTADDDVSWAIKSQNLTYGYHQEQYDRFMSKCRQASPYCKSKEELRLYMNQHQPASVYNFTRTGYAKIKTPPALWKLLNDFYQKHKGQQVVEYPETISPYHNSWDSSTEIIRLDNTSLAGGGPYLKSLISRAVQPVLEEWTGGQKLAPVSTYGIRIYRNQSILAPHVDRMPLVTSCIINIDQDVDEPWLLEVFDHSGKARNITMEPGDMVLYESHSIIHGRPFPLRGNFFANAFLHFEPVGSAFRDSDDATGLNHNWMPSYLIPGSVWEEQWNEDNPNGWDRLYSANSAMQAVTNGDDRTLQLIAEMRPEALVEKDSNGWAPIHQAVRYGRLDMIQFLIDHGVPADQKAGVKGGSKEGVFLPLELALHLLGADHKVTKFLWTVTSF